jgi:hypothetical protein
VSDLIAKLKNGTPYKAKACFVCITIILGFKDLIKKGQFAA